MAVYLVVSTFFGVIFLFLSGVIFLYFGVPHVYRSIVKKKSGRLQERIGCPMKR